MTASGGGQMDHSHITMSKPLLANANRLEQEWGIGLSRSGILELVVNHGRWSPRTFGSVFSVFSSYSSTGVFSPDRKRLILLALPRGLEPLFSP